MLFIVGGLALGLGMGFLISPRLNPNERMIVVILASTAYAIAGTLWGIFYNAV